MSTELQCEMRYDLIGDIHGHAAKLEALLIKLGYTTGEAGWKAPQGRQAIFVGDLIDRGPEQVKVVNIVRRMVESGDARAVMGNHELNAIGYITPHPNKPGEFLRNRSPNKVAQHIEFLSQVGEGSDLHFEIVDWFRTLPMHLDLGGLRAVHAWWHAPHIDLVAQRHPGGQPINEDFLLAVFSKGTPEWEAVEGITKGLEVRLPEGVSFVDHSSTVRKEVRMRWWLGQEVTLQEAAILDEAQRQQLPAQKMGDGYNARTIDDVPVFIGHYWMKGKPVIQTQKVACLDWSAGGDGPVVAYRWDGEAHLSNDKFVCSH
jgi:hypothetical protein